jgi:hypothetical protein
MTGGVCCKLGGGWVQSNATLNVPGMGWNGSRTDSRWLIGGASNTASRHTARSNSNTIISRSQTGLRLRFPRCPNRDIQMIKAGINYKFEAGADPASEVSKYSRDPAKDENLQKQS